MKKIVFLAIIITCLSVAYYLAIFLPQENHRLIIECRSLGQKLEKETTNPYDNSLRMSPEYYYNPKLKKCFYCGGYTHDGFMAQFIIDAYTNKEVSIYVKNIKTGEYSTLNNIQEFDKKKNELFNER